MPPCNCDHMEPREHELESRKVACLIRYVHQQLGQRVVTWVARAADAPYGDAAQIHVLTETLCELTHHLEKEGKLDTVMYDGRKPLARQYADWWEAHEKADKARAESEACKKRQHDLARSAKAKLTPAELEALLAARGGRRVDIPMEPDV